MSGLSASADPLRESRGGHVVTVTKYGSDPLKWPRRAGCAREPGGAARRREGLVAAAKAELFERIGGDSWREGLPVAGAGPRVRGAPAAGAGGAEAC